MILNSQLLIKGSGEKLSSLKFILYLKNKEISAVNKMLEKVLQLPLNEQQNWADENGEMLNQALDIFVEDSNTLLDKITLDDEILELSQKLIFALRDALHSAEALLGSQAQLDS